MVKIHRHKLLHYVLIILLMFAPLRGVMAMQQTRCDMDSHIAMLNVDQDAINGTLTSVYSDHHEMMGMSPVASLSVQKVAYSHDCCSGSSKCVGNCDMSISTSLLLQGSFYTPNFINVSALVVFSTDLIKKGSTPPFRPPLVSYS